MIGLPLVDPDRIQVFLIKQPSKRVVAPVLLPFWFLIWQGTSSVPQTVITHLLSFHTLYLPHHHFSGCFSFLVTRFALPVLVEVGLKYLLTVVVRQPPIKSFLTLFPIPFLCLQQIDQFRCFVYLSFNTWILLCFFGIRHFKLATFLLVKASNHLNVWMWIFHVQTPLCFTQAHYSKKYGVALALQEFLLSHFPHPLVLFILSLAVITIRMFTTLLPLPDPILLLMSNSWGLLYFPGWKLFGLLLKRKLPLDLSLMTYIITQLA